MDSCKIELIPAVGFLVKLFKSAIFSKERILLQYLLDKVFDFAHFQSLADNYSFPDRLFAFYQRVVFELLHDKRRRHNHVLEDQFEPGFKQANQLLGPLFLFLLHPVLPIVRKL